MGSARNQAPRLRATKSSQTGLQAEIARRERVEAELREAKRIAEEANAAKDEFLARISHELRTPLTPVLLGLSDLSSRVSIPEDIRIELGMLQQHVEMEATLIDDLLNLTQMSSRSLPVHLEQMDVHATLVSAIASCQADFERNKVHLALTHSAGDVSVMGDSALLEQAFWNLLTNAAKFTPAGGHVHVCTWNESKSFCVEIKDDGIGIEPETLPRLFTLFAKGKHQIKGMPDGFGVGLAYSKNIMDAHQGKITIQSDGHGKGTRVLISIPTAQTAVGQASRKPDSVATLPRNLRVLVVEDHRATARLLRTLLERDGHRVTLAHTMADAKEQIGLAEFDLLLSDLGLPDGHGADLPPLIRRKRRIPSIALSGYGQEKDLERTRRAGFGAHLVKPVTVAQLRQTIAQVLQDTRD